MSFRFGKKRFLLSPFGTLKKKKKQSMISTTSVSLCTKNTMSTTERARVYAMTVPKPVVRVAPVAPVIEIKYQLTGNLVDLRDHLAHLEERLVERRVGDFMDTTAACTGHLYDIQRELQCAM